MPYLHQLKSVIGRPLLEKVSVGFDETFLNQSALGTSQLAALFPVIHNTRQRIILVVQTRLVALSRCRVCIVDFRPVDLLEGVHGADSTDEFQMRVINQQVAGKIEGQGRDAIGRHEITNLNPIFLKYSSVREYSS